MSEKKSPVAKVSVGMISAAIWRNASQGNKAFYNTTFENRFKDDQGNFQTSASYGQNDLLLLAHCATLAFDKILELKAQDKETGAAEAA